MVAAMAGPRSVLVLYAHPYPRRSRAGRALLAAVEELPFVSVRSLYDLYPDFAIDVEAEQRAMAEADVIVWQTPFYWYGVPSLLQHWFEKVLLEGWAYGDDASALCGKSVQWVTTTGTPRSAYQPEGIHAHHFDAFVPAIQQTAQFCGMKWEPPLVVHGIFRMSDDELATHARAYRTRLEELSAAEGRHRGAHA
jgi:glutathione-regulated potassium-efflux system ancillary protein KefF